MSRCEYCGESLCGGGCPEQHEAERIPPAEIVRTALRVARHEGVICNDESNRALAYLNELEDKAHRYDGLCK